MKLTVQRGYGFRHEIVDGTGATIAVMIGGDDAALKLARQFAASPAAFDALMAVDEVLERQPMSVARDELVSLARLVRDVLSEIEKA